MLLLVEWQGRAFCCDAASTAFDFPLIDGTVSAQPGGGGPQIEVPLDGTRYDLATGGVLEWCPRSNAVRFVLGALKSRSDPKPLPVHDCVWTDGGDIYVRLSS